VRGLRAQGPRRRLDHEPSDRGGSYRDDAQDQAWRRGLDQRLPRQELHEEAGRDAHGLGQRLARRVGLRGRAGPRDVRGRPPAVAARERGAPPGRAEAVREDEGREERGRALLTRASELRDLTDDDLEHRLAERRKELFNLRFQSVTGALENSARLQLAQREIARVLTVVNEREAEKARAAT